jgi:hypothetical protein
MRRVVLAGICSFLVGALAATGLARQQPGQAAIPLEQPSTWVPFTADVLHLEDGRRSVGRFYRSSDGSARTDLLDDYGDRRIRQTEISNFRLRVFYRNLGREVWLTGPLPYSDRAFKPRPWSSRAVGLFPYPFRLALLKDQDGSLQASEGLEAWIFSNEYGATRLMVPALNFFPVFHSRVTGLRRVYSNIEFVSDVDASIFEPPAGAPLEHVSPAKMQ